jgi:ABC-2 type transport system ATP-binding protein
MTEVLQTESLRKTYKNLVALNKLDITVEKGQIYGLLGPNGSGKTTTLGILLGAIKADQGTFSWFKNGEKDENRKKIGALLETPNFYPYLNAIDNLKIVGKIKDVPDLLTHIEKVLKQVDLWKRKTTKFNAYSLGMKQRLAIASAMLSDPDVLVLDEPTNGLDPQGIAEIRTLILDIAKGGKTVIIASHILDEIEKMCTHVGILKNGKLIQQGTMQEIMSQDKLLLINGESHEKLKATIDELPALVFVKELNGQLLIRAEETFSPSQVNQLIAEKGVYLNALSVYKKNLETIFLELINP